MTRSIVIPLAVPLAAALSLSGCALLGGGGKPADLYRFGAAPPPSPDAGVPMPATRRPLVLMPVQFAAEIDGDRLLASQGQSTLYIKGARWIAPAPTLFTQAMLAGFRARAPSIEAIDRLAGRADAAVLRISIDRMEADYADPAAAPRIVIGGTATLVDATTHTPIGSYRLGATQPADRNDARAIVAAFDAATASVVAATVDWANATLPPSTPVRGR